MANCIHRDKIVISAERAGVIFPVHYWGMPEIVKDFIRKVEFAKPAYLFSVVTCAGIPGTTLLKLDTMLKNKGSLLSAGYACFLPSNCTHLVDAFEESKQLQMFREAREKLSKIIRVIKNLEKAKIESSNLFINFITSIIHRAAVPKNPGFDKNFWVNDNCVSCGQCIKICPVNNISMDGDSGKKWLHKCEQCYACLQWCPAKAIQYGSKTSKRTRYHHPEITVSEISKREANTGV
ncbi:MAG: 4Fe-4S dicluster domain-containing protein [bacterium]|nr:4Fe-4S dicluster domain-containing protein [bacterium]